MAIEEAQLIQRDRRRARHPAAGRAPPVPEARALMAGARSPEEIRRSIEANRAELGMAVEKLRGEVASRHRLARPAARAPEAGPDRRGGRGLRARRRHRRRGPPVAAATSPAPPLGSRLPGLAPSYTLPQTVAGQSQLSTRTIVRVFFTLVALVVLLYMLYLVRSVIGLLFIAIFLSVALGPAVDRTKR